MSRRRLLFTLIATALTAALAALAVARLGSAGDLAQRVDAAIASVREHGAANGFGLAALQLAAALTGIVPASLVCVAAGALYGLGYGFVISAAGTMVGAVLAFALSRSTLRPFIQRRVGGRRLLGLDAAIGREGWRFVCLLRVSPIMPFVATSYALGLSSISFRNYMIGTTASLPALIGYVGMGAIAGAGLSAWTSAVGPLQWGLLGLGLAATLALILQVGDVVSKVARG